MAQSGTERSAPFLAADDAASPMMASLRARVQVDEAAAVKEFWEEVARQGTPLIEPVPNDEQHSFVSFVWRGTEQTRNVIIVDGVAVAVGGVNPINSAMSRLPATDVWYRTYKVRNDARFAYKLSENDSLQSFLDPNRQSPHVVADPLNPHLFATGQSYVELAKAPTQDLATRTPSRSGSVERRPFHSVILNNDRTVWVYTPPDFRPAGQKHRLLVTFGGAYYTTWVPVPRILDNLLSDRRIEPLVAVVVGAAQTDDTEVCSTRFADFVATELVPWMRTHYHATDDRRKTVIAGSSLGGLTATCAAFHHPEVFASVLSQSGSYWWKPATDTDGEWVTRQFTRSPRLPLRFVIEVGEMEVPEQLGTNRRLRDVLRAKKYPVEYREFNGNHTYLAWRGSFGLGLEALSGGGRR
jgi:enterochelin esterase-like enzyme